MSRPSSATISSSIIAPRDDKLGERLLDANRTIGQPNKFTTIFGKLHHGNLQTVIEHMDLANPVIRSHYRNGFIKQYVRDHLILRTEAATNNVTDYTVRKAVDNLPSLRRTLSAINANYLNVQQDIVETFLDRGQLRKLPQPTITAAGKRIPGRKLDNPRQLALMHALVRFSHIAAGNNFTTAKLHSRSRRRPRLQRRSLHPRFAALRSFKTSRQGLCRKASPLAPLPAPSQRADLLSPVKADARVQSQHRAQLDRLYQRVIDDLDKLIQAVGLKAT